MNKILSILVFAALIFSSTTHSFEQWQQQNLMQGGFAASMPVYDMPINVMTVSGKAIDCRPVSDSTFYKCDDNSFFQPANPYSKMVRRNDQGEILTETVESIVNFDGQILFVNRGFEDIAPQGLAGKYNQIINLKFSLEMAEIQEPEFHHIRRVIAEQEKDILQKFKDGPYNIKLKNGSSLQCSQAFPDKPEEPASEQDLYLPYMTRPESCGVFDCVDPKQKKQSAGLKTRMYFHPHPQAHAYPTIMQMKDGKLTGFEDFEAIENKNGDVIQEEMKFPTEPTESYQPVAQSQFSNPTQSLPRDLFKADVFPEIKNEEGRLANPFFFQGLSSLESSCQGSDAFLQDLQEHANQKISQHELAQVFMFLNNDMVSFYVDPSKAREHFCFDNGRYYSPEAYEKRDYNFDHQGANKVLTQKQVQELFDYAKSMDDIAFDYKIDGCYARAHLMARRFEEKGHLVEKAWINGDLMIPGDDPVRWSYHVAPSVYAYDDQGRVQRMIIDPSVSDKPLTSKEWSDMMTGHIDNNVQQTGFPFPSNSAPYRRASLTFTNSDPYYPLQNTVMDEKAKMEAAVKTMSDYLPLQNQPNNF